MWRVMTLTIPSIHPVNRLSINPVDRRTLEEKEVRMNRTHILRTGAGAFVAIVALGGSAGAATTVQVGASGKTYASSVVQCAPDPTTGVLSPAVEAGLFNPKHNAKATVSLNGTTVATVTTDNPFANVWLADGDNAVVVAINKKTADSYAFAVQPGECSTSGNTFSDDRTLEYAASGKSYATVIPGCALNPDTGQPQRYVNLFDNGTYLLDVSVNGVPLTQLSETRHTPVFLSPGWNVISAANGTLSIDYYVRDGGDGACLPDTSGNTFSADGTLEYAASGKSYATVTPGCAWNAATGQPQPYVNLLDDDAYLLDVSVNGVPLTQLSATRPHTAVFLSAGLNVISAANGTLSIDNYVRDGGDGMCTLP